MSESTRSWIVKMPWRAIRDKIDSKSKTISNKKEEKEKEKERKRLKERE